MLRIHDFQVIQDRLKHEGFVVCEGQSDDPARFLLSVAASVGSLDLEIDEEIAGLAIMGIKYDPLKASQTSRPAYFSSDAFPLHTDLSYVVNPPRFLLMLCLVPDAAGGGLTKLSDCQQTWSRLSMSDRTQLGTAQFRFRNPPNTPEGDAGVLSVSYSSPQWNIWRFRRDSMIVPDDALLAVDHFGFILEQTAITFGLSAGELLIIDNHRMVHGRTAFDSDSPRHFLRCYAQDSSRRASLKGAATAGW